MALGVEAAFFADAIADGGEFGDADGFDVVGVDADEHFCGFAAVDELVVDLIGVEWDALDDAGFEHEFEGSVDGGFGDAVAAGAEEFDESIGLEDAIDADDGVEDARAFGSVFESFGLECAPEDGAEGLDDLEGVLVAVV